MLNYVILQVSLLKQHADGLARFLDESGDLTHPGPILENCFGLGLVMRLPEGKSIDRSIPVVPGAWLLPTTSLALSLVSTWSLGEWLIQAPVIPAWLLRTATETAFPDLDLEEIPEATTTPPAPASREEAAMFRMVALRFSGLTAARVLETLLEESGENFFGKAPLAGTRGEGTFVFRWPKSVPINEEVHIAPDISVAPIEMNEITEISDWRFETWSVPLIPACLLHLAEAAGVVRAVSTETVLGASCQGISPTDDCQGLARNQDPHAFAEDVPNRRLARVAIIEVLEMLGPFETLGPDEIARRGKITPTACRAALGVMKQKGDVVSPTRGKYRLPSPINA